MKKTALSTTTLSLLGLGLSLPAWAVDAQLSFNLPDQGARARRPYVAVWVEKAGSQDFVGNIAVWYDMRKPNNVGATKWLPDLRTWWRVSGSKASFPIDGVSGATRAAGDQVIDLDASELMKKLPAGNYEVVMEVAREHGGHDLVRLPMAWPPRSATQADASGKEELGAVRLNLKP